jgi:hypothetical protein
LISGRSLLSVFCYSRSVSISSLSLSRFSRGGVAKSVGGEAALELLEALFKLVEGVVNLVAGLGKLVALSVDIVDISVDFFTFGENITLLVVPFFKAVEVAAEFLANTALSLLATA